MSKVRINDLARELEVKSKAILDVLREVGVTDAKTHSSSLEADEAQRVRAHFQRGGSRNGGSAQAKSDTTTQKIDWSRVSKPGDVLKAIQQRKEEAAIPFRFGWLCGRQLVRKGMWRPIPSGRSGCVKHNRGSS